MKDQLSTVFLEKIAIVFQLLGIIFVSVLAIADQLVLHQLPCPLCLLLRIGFIFIAFGFLLNLKFGFRPLHYSIILISALFTSFVALRQIVLHIIPGTGAYGSPIFGLHLYTWCFIISMIIVVISALMLGMENQYQHATNNQRGWRPVTNLFFSLVVFIITVNIISVILECGFEECPDNPDSYTLIESFRQNNVTPK